MKYTDLTKEEWNQLQYSQKMTELENFLLRMIIKFYEKDPSNAEDAFSGLYNHICSEWLTPVVEQEQDCDNNGGNCDDYLLEPSCDKYNDWD